MNVLLEIAAMYVYYQHLIVPTGTDRKFFLLVLETLWSTILIQNFVKPYDQCECQFACFNTRALLSSHGPVILHMQVKQSQFKPAPI